MIIATRFLVSPLGFVALGLSTCPRGLLSAIFQHKARAMSHAGAEWSNLLASLGRKLKVLNTASMVGSHDTKHMETRNHRINHASRARHDLPHMRSRAREKQ